MRTPLIYIECDLPDGVTLSQWRKRHVRPVKQRRFPRLARRTTARRPSPA